MLRKKKMETLRLRLEFKNVDILTDAQKSQGLNKSWLLVPQPHSNFTTVAALSAFILEKFHLNQACPHGILLSMDGFALPPFVSISILKDSDVISVQKIGHLTVGGIDITDKVEGQQHAAIDCVNTGSLLLENEEFDKESGGYESEESEDESAEDGKDISKKRKASQKLRSSKKKKQRSEPHETVATESHKESEYVETPPENELPSKKKSKSKKGKSSETENQTTNGDNARPDENTKKDLEYPSDLKINEQFEENAEDVDGATNASGSTKKGPSRSALRQYAKRQFLRDMKKVLGKNEDSPSKQDKKWKKRQNKVEKRTITDQYQNEGPKGLLHLKQFGGRDISNALSKPEEENQNHKTHGDSNKDKDASNDAVPIKIRPGRIRFQALEEDEELQQVRFNLLNDEDDHDTFEGNGITSKKKFQKWGTNSGSTSCRNDYEPKEANLENIYVSEGMDFAKLPLLPGMPEKGDVIAYRLLELSSSWTPQISPYQVGKVSSCDSQSQKIELMPVPEYHAVSKKVDEDDITAQQDGPLEIDFTNLVDVRAVKNNNLDQSSSKGIVKHADGHICNENGATSMSLGSNEKCINTMVKGNGGSNYGSPAQPRSKPGVGNGGSSWGNPAQPRSKPGVGNGAPSWGNPSQSPSKPGVSNGAPSWGNPSQSPSKPGVGNGAPSWGNPVQSPSTPVTVENGMDPWRAALAKEKEDSKESSWGKIIPLSRNAWSYRAFSGSTAPPTSSYQGRGRGPERGGRGGGRGRGRERGRGRGRW